MIAGGLTEVGFYFRLDEPAFGLEPVTEPGADAAGNGVARIERYLGEGVVGVVQADMLDDELVTRLPRILPLPER